MKINQLKSVNLKNGMILWIGVLGGVGCAGGTPGSNESLDPPSIVDPSREVPSTEGSSDGSSPEVGSLNPKGGAKPSPVSESLDQQIRALRSERVKRRYSPVAYQWIKRFLQIEIRKEGERLGYDGVEWAKRLLDEDPKSADLDRIRDAYSKGVQRHQYGEVVTQRSEGAHSVLGDQGSGVSLHVGTELSLMDQLVLNALNRSHSERFSGVVSVFGNEINEQALRWMQAEIELLSDHSLNLLREQRVACGSQNCDEDLAKLAKMTVREWIRSQNELKRILDSQDAHAQEHALSSLEAVLASKLFETFRDRPEQIFEKKNQNSNEKLKREIKHASKQLYLLTRVLLEYEKQASRRWKETLDEQKKVSANLTQIAEEAKKESISPSPLAAKGVKSSREFSHDFLSGKKSAQELLAQTRIELAQKNLSDEDRKKLESRKTLLQGSISLNGKFGEVLDGAGALLQIAETMGVDSKTLNQASQVVEVGTAVHQVFSGFLNGGFLGMASSLGKLAGLGAPDVGEIRHREVMSQLGVLAQGQEALLQYSRAIHEGQIAIFEQQKVILESVEQISRQIAGMHESLSAEIQGLREEVLFSRKMLRESLGGDLALCQSFEVESSNVVDHFWDKSSRSFKDAESFGDFLRERTDLFSACRSGINRVLQSPNGVSSLLLVQAQSGENQSERDQINRTLELYRSVYQYWSQREGADRDRLYSTLSFAPVQTQSLSFWRAELSAETQRGFSRSNEKLFDPMFMNHLLSSEDLMALVRTVNQMMPFFDLKSEVPDGGFSLSESLMSIRDPIKPRLRLYEWHRQLMRYLQLAIAQQSLLAGVGVIPELYEDLRSPSHENQSRAVALIGNNPYLALNFTVYALRKSLAEQGVSADVIHFARKERSGALLDQALRLPLKREWSEKGSWMLVFGQAKVEIPPLEVLKADRMSYPPAFGPLLEWRKSVASHLAEFEVRDSGRVQMGLADLMAFYSLL